MCAEIGGGGGGGGQMRPGARDWSHDHVSACVTARPSLRQIGLAGASSPGVTCHQAVQPGTWCWLRGTGENRNAFARHRRSRLRLMTRLNVFRLADHRSHRDYLFFS